MHVIILPLPPRPAPIILSGSRAGGPTPHVSGYTTKSDNQRSLEDWGMRGQLGDCDRQGQGPSAPSGASRGPGSSWPQDRPISVWQTHQPGSQEELEDLGRDSPSLKPEALTEPSPRPGGPCEALKSSPLLLAGSGQSDPRCDVGEQFIQTRK